MNSHLKSVGDLFSAEVQPKLKPCECSGWQNGMPQIIGAQCLADIHGIHYTGGTFLYCPWCGKKREEEVVNDI